ncbi:hypothetical protein BOTBODRAFT_216752 [Botryobasidium botryosum FD-172 SS1]|uniref:Uncharacterized protein n=1 Tax=Botryobasidium botryosum (strain FD-172 SS1) TaxID=930990 RepID=A0A067N4M5_BOTB1|nr:hypothetical protein BOTBODRAFT_216752 [Botryobasidium botryosum FD-172 SS1]
MLVSTTIENSTSPVFILIMARKTTQKTLAEENSKLTRTIAELEARCKSAESTADKLKKQQAQTATLPKTALIPRPPGENGKRGWKLINHMGLGSAEGDDAATEHAKKAEYNHALDVVRTAMGHAHWDFNRRSDKQDPGSIRSRAVPSSGKVRVRLGHP